MYRFLVQPRWIAMLVAVLALGALFVQLARWQYDRSQDRGSANSQIEQNLSRPPKPAEQVLNGRSPGAGTEWTTVTATGTYDVDQELLVRYRYLDTAPGFEVLTPLVTENGRALLVDRGWVPAQGGTTELPDVAPPASGEVTLTGRVRASEAGPADQVRPDTGQIRFIDIGRIAEAMPYPIYGGYVELTEQRPAPANDAPELLPAPEMDPGPHLSYAVQWVLFTLIALGGVGYLVYDEAHGGARRRRTRKPSSEDVEADNSADNDQNEGGGNAAAGRVGQLDGAH